MGHKEVEKLPSIKLPIIIEGDLDSWLVGRKEGGRYFWKVVAPDLPPPRDEIIEEQEIDPDSPESRREAIETILREFEVDGLTQKAAEGLIDALCEQLLELKSGKSGGDRQKESAASILIRLALEKCVLFKDEHNKAFAAVKLNGGEGIAVMPVRGRDFKNLLHKLLWESGSKAANAEATNSAINTLEAIARFEGEQYRLNLRVAWKEDAILYDTGRDDWKLIKIDKAGWRWIEHTEPIFRRYQHMQAQVEPKETEAEDFKKLLNHVRIANGDGLVFLCHVATFLIPDTPHPMPIIFGAQGSAKTTTCEMIRRVIDPSSLGVLSFPHDNRELIQKLAHNYVALFDNVSRLSKEQSDILCRAVTGTAQSKRELYTDDEDFYYKFIRCVGTNGINISGLEPDFLDRAILYELERIPITERREKREIMEAFEKDLPAIVGGLFSAISKALGIVDEVREELKGRLPRMADFCVWAEAIARALGYEPLRFYNAYMERLRRQNKEILEADVIGDLLVKFMENRESWEGTPTELLKNLTKLAEEYGLDSIRGFPKAPHALTRRLNRLKPNLAEEGIVIERDRESDKSRKRKIRIHRGKASEVSKRPTSPGEFSDALSDANNHCGESVRNSVRLKPVLESDASDAMDTTSRYSSTHHYIDDTIEAALEVLRSITWDGWEASQDELMSAVRHVSTIRRVSEGDLLAVLTEAGLTFEEGTAKAPEDILARIVRLKKQDAHSLGGDAE